MKYGDELQGMLQELLDYEGEEGNRPLTDWEMKFLDDIKDNPHSKVYLSAGQITKINKIWGDIFG